MIKDPEQIIFDQVFKACEGLGLDTYATNPDASAPYPFVRMGEQFDQDVPTKTNKVLVGTSQLTLHIFGIESNHKLVTDIKHDIKLTLKKLDSPNFCVNQINSTTQTENPDNSVSLLHVILTIDCEYFV